jgi:hypothetical protein
MAPDATSVSSSSFSSSSPSARNPQRRPSSPLPLVGHEHIPELKSSGSADLGDSDAVAIASLDSAGTTAPRRTSSPLPLIGKDHVPAALRNLEGVAATEGREPDSENVDR